MFISVAIVIEIICRIYDLYIHRHINPDKKIPIRRVLYSAYFASIILYLAFQVPYLYESKSEDLGYESLQFLPAEENPPQEKIEEINKQSLNRDDIERENEIENDKEKSRKEFREFIDESN